MSSHSVPGTTSVIIPCWNQLEYTRQCIAALLRHTRGKWELIAINNGSTDGTAGYLANIQHAAPLPVTVIANTKNLGFPAAINQRLGSARGEYLVLLNNDVVVTEGWLGQLIGLAASGLTTDGDEDEGSGVGRWVVEMDGESIRKMLATEETVSTESTYENMERVREVTDAYPGRSIKVIYLAPVGNGEKGRACDRGGKIGLVGPMSNYAAPPQLVEDVPYHDLNEMNAFARRWRDEHRGKWTAVRKLSGFCLLMTRALYDAVGGLDERFGLGFFDDDDLAERARRAGFELALARDLFVHHFGSRTFAGNGVNAEKLLAENAQRFAAKWGDSVPQGRPVSLRPFHAEPQRGAVGEVGPQKTPKDADENAIEQGLAFGAHSPIPTRELCRQAPSETAIPFEPPSVVHLRPSVSSADVLQLPPVPAVDRARVSLTMIVRDEEENLPRALESVRGLFDEIVVVDTGSRDGTVEIAREFGARVFHFTWIDDFAAARNAALEHAEGDYAFWLDADDLLEPVERAKLEALLERLPRGGRQTGEGTADRGRAVAPFGTAYVVRCACDPGPTGSGGDTVVDHVRLFPLFEGLRWTYKVHEQILPSLRRSGVPVKWTKIKVRHTGYVDRALRDRKFDRDKRILLGELGERPNDPFILFNLGMIANERKEWRDALTYLNRSLAGSAPSDSITRKLYALIARVQEMLGDTEAALRTCAEGLSIEPDDAELWFRKGVAHRHRGEPAEAERAWRRILSLRRPEKFASLDQGIYGHVTRRNLAALAGERGDVDEAQRQWRAILAECPADKQALQKLAEFS